jgi:SLOG in TRPM, prokaryote
VHSNGVLTNRRIAFLGGSTALAVVAPADVSGDDAADALGLSTEPRGLVVLNGTTEAIPPGRAVALRRAADALAGVVVDERLTVLTGGTDAGIFGLFGRALSDRRTAPCIGVAPLGAVTWPGRDGVETGAAGLVPLEPHHSHFLLVEGASWGTETRALIELSQTLAAERPSLVVLAGGGEGARREVLAQVRRGRRVLVLAGSGRFADEVVAARHGGIAGDPVTAEVATSTSVTVIAAVEPAHLAARVRAALGLAEARS